MLRFLISAALVAVLVACGSEPVRAIQQLLQNSPGSASLKTGLRQYDDGAYAESATTLQGAIEQGLNDPESAEAHKYLAFMHCAAGRERSCREEFRKALGADPALELTPAEVGHPIWGPVFRSVKAGR